MIDHRRLWFTLLLIGSVADIKIHLPGPLRQLLSHLESGVGLGGNSGLRV